MKNFLKNLNPTIRNFLIIVLFIILVFVGYGFYHGTSNEDEDDSFKKTILDNSTIPIVFPEIAIPQDRKLKADEVMKILSTLKDFGSQTEEKYSFVKSKTKEVWVNLGMGHPNPESGWSSWKLDNVILDSEDDYYPGTFDEITLEDVDIFNTPGKEKLLKIFDGFTSNVRFLIFDKNGNYVDQLGYFWQKYGGVEFWPIFIDSIPYLAVEHMIGGGSGTATYVVSIYQINKTGKITRVLTNMPWDSYGEPITRDFKDGTKTIGRKEFNSKIIQTGNQDGVSNIKFEYLITYKPYNKSGPGGDLEQAVDDSVVNKYSISTSGFVVFSYNTKLGQFITKDTKWEETIWEEAIKEYFGQDYRDNSILVL